jgi:hypothetical protein
MIPVKGKHGSFCRYDLAAASFSGKSAAGSVPDFENPRALAKMLQMRIAEVGTGPDQGRAIVGCPCVNLAMVVPAQGEIVSLRNSIAAR